MTIPQYPSKRAQRKMENDRTGDQKLLVARSNERSRKIRGWM